jgi:hypothetical protein
MRANSKRKKRSRVFGSPMRTTVVVLSILALTGTVIALAGRSDSNTAPAVQQETQVEEPAASSTPVKKIGTGTPKPAPSAVPVKGAPVASATAPPAAPANEPADEPVTVTGCLELDNQEYRLTDTEGQDAPKSRSWKSGFLKKRGAELEVIDAAKSLRLATHLGQRVTLSGVVVDRTMQARTLVVAAKSCE